MSADGRYVIFQSFASNLLGKDNDNNSVPDVFIHDRNILETQRVTIGYDGSETDEPSASTSTGSGGRYVIFGSFATNLIEDDNNAKRDIFVYDRQNDTTERISVSSDGTEADELSLNASISADGRYVAFDSDATNLVPGDSNGRTDVFVYDRQTSATERISVNSEGHQAENGFSDDPMINADGRFVVFKSDANNLVSNDTNNKTDIFVHDLKTGTTERVSMAFDGSEANGSSNWPVLTFDGRLIAFSSKATNLVQADTDPVEDIFITPNPLFSLSCDGDFEPDGDVDGMDLANYIADQAGINLNYFAEDYGKAACPQ
jgi:Tol biopolymer transport system component